MRSWSRASTASIAPSLATAVELILIAHAHMRHIHAQHPEQPVAFALAQLAERFVETPSPCRRPRDCRPGRCCARSCRSRIGRIFTSGSEQVLQEDHLQLDGVLEGVAVVFHADAAPPPRSASQSTSAVSVTASPSGVRKFLRVRPKRLRLAVVRGRQNHEGPVAMLRADHAIGGAVGLPPARRADVRRGDPDQVAVGGCGAFRPRSSTPLICSAQLRQGPRDMPSPHAPASRIGAAANSCLRAASIAAKFSSSRNPAVLSVSIRCWSQVRPRPDRR